MVGYIKLEENRKPTVEKRILPNDKQQLSQSKLVTFDDLNLVPFSLLSLMFSRSIN